MSFMAERRRLGIYAEKDCRLCGVTFETYDFRRRYCDACYGSRELKVPMSRNESCESCGKPMPRANHPFGGTYPVKRIDARYCSNACRQRAYREKGKAE